MAASAVAGGAVAAAGGFPLLAVSDHASYDQAYHNQQHGKNQYSSHNDFLSKDSAGWGRRTVPSILRFTLSQSACQLPCRDGPACRS